MVFFTLSLPQTARAEATFEKLPIIVLDALVAPISSAAEFKWGPTHVPPAGVKEYLRVKAELKDVWDFSVLIGGKQPENNAFEALEAELLAFQTQHAHILPLQWNEMVEWLDGCAKYVNESATDFPDACLVTVQDVISNGETENQVFFLRMFREPETRKVWLDWTKKRAKFDTWFTEHRLSRSGFENVRNKIKALTVQLAGLSTDTVLADLKKCEECDELSAALKTILKDEQTRLLTRLNQETPWRTWAQEQVYIRELVDSTHLTIRSQTTAAERLSLLAKIYENLVLSLVKTSSRPERIFKNLTSRISRAAVGALALPIYIGVKGLYLGENVIDVGMRASTTEILSPNVLALMAFVWPTGNATYDRISRQRERSEPRIFQRGRSFWRAELMEAAEGYSDVGTEELGTALSESMASLLGITPGEVPFSSLGSVLSMAYSLTCAARLTEQTKLIENARAQTE